MKATGSTLHLAETQHVAAQGDMSLISACIEAFEDTRDTRYFFPGGNVEHLLEQLVSQVTRNDPGLSMVTAEPGHGKTMLRSELQRRLTEAGCVCATLECGWLDFDGVLLELTSQLEGRRMQASEFPDRYSRLAALKESLVRRIVRPGRKLVVLLDEAQQTDSVTLEGIRSLTNISAERKNYLAFVFFGQPEFESRLSADEKLMSRVAACGRLQSYSEELTAEYIKHRVKVRTGGSDSPFTAAALTTLHTISGGVPRVINKHCKLALEACREQGRAIVDKESLVNIVEITDIEESWPDSCLLSG